MRANGDLEHLKSFNCRQSIAKALLISGAGQRRRYAASRQRASTRPHPGGETDASEATFMSRTSVSLH